MLVFGRADGQSIIIDLRAQGLGLTEITLIERRRGRIGIEAPKGVRVDRREIFEKNERRKESE
jgi:sRNA-binding carbon storage regulator CsrA